MRVLVVGGLLVLSGCGGGGSTTGTNYSDAPPMATIVATPTPLPSPSATPEPAPSEDAAEANIAD